MFGSEEKTSPVKTILTGLICCLIGAGVFWYFQTRTTAVLSASNTQIFAPHTTFAAKGDGFHVVGQLGESEDDLYVVTTLSIKNNLNIPIFLNSIDATYTAPDDSVMDTKAISPADTARVEASFPDITPMMNAGTKPFPLTDAIPANATVEGTVLLHFSGLTAQVWRSRKSATMTANFTHQAPQTITIP